MNNVYYINSIFSGGSILCSSCNSASLTVAACSIYLQLIKLGAGLNGRPSIGSGSSVFSPARTIHSSVYSHSNTFHCWDTHISSTKSAVDTHTATQNMRWLVHLLKIQKVWEDNIWVLCLIALHIWEANRHTDEHRAQRLTYEVSGVGHSVEVRQIDPFNESWVHQHWSFPAPWVVCKTIGRGTGRKE